MYGVKLAEKAKKEGRQTERKSLKKKATEEPETMCKSPKKKRENAAEKVKKEEPKAVRKSLKKMENAAEKVVKKEEPKAVRKSLKKMENAAEKTKEVQQAERNSLKKKAKEEPEPIRRNVKKNAAEKAKEEAMYKEMKKREDAKKAAEERMKTTIWMTRDLRKKQVKEIIKLTKIMKLQQLADQDLQKQLTRKAVAEEKFVRHEDLMEQIQGKAEMARMIKDKYFDACDMGQCVEEKAVRSEKQLTDSVLLLQANKTRKEQQLKALQEATEKKKSLAENQRVFKKHVTNMFSVLDELVTHIDDIPAELQEKIAAFSKCDLRAQVARTGHEEDADMATAVERLLKKEAKQKLAPGEEKTEKTVKVEAKEPAASKGQQSGEGGQESDKSVTEMAQELDEAAMMEKVEKLMKERETTMCLRPSNSMLQQDLAMTPSPQKKKQMNNDDDEDRLTIVISDSDDQSADDKKTPVDPLAKYVDIVMQMELD